MMSVEMKKIPAPLELLVVNMWVSKKMEGLGTVDAPNDL